MAEQFPPSLQATFNRAGWRESTEDVVIRTETETGPQKRRRRYTRPDKMIEGSIWISSSEYGTYDDFVTLILQNYTLSFEFPHPITHEIKEYVYEAPETKTAVGYDTFELKVKWRQVA